MSFSLKQLWLFQGILYMTSAVELDINHFQLNLAPIIHSSLTLHLHLKRINYMSLYNGRQSWVQICDSNFKKMNFCLAWGLNIVSKKTMLPWSRPIFKPERWSKLECYVCYRSCIWKLSVHVDMITHLKLNMEMIAALRWRQQITWIWLKN